MSQISRSGDGAPRIQTNQNEQVQETQSPETKSVEQQSITPGEQAAHKATAKETSHRKAHLAFEGASQRAALNGKLDIKAFADAQKPVVINGTSGNDTIHVSKAPGLMGKMGLYEVDVNGQKQYFTQEQMKNLQIKAGAGNDTVIVDADVKVGVNVDGGSGNDVIIGGGGDDVLNGGSGNDIIFGRGGNDRINGGRGDDKIFGGAGSDVILGGRGNDTISGGKGNDAIGGGGGNDSIDGGQGIDLVSGGPGFDQIKNGINLNDPKLKR